MSQPPPQENVSGFYLVPCKKQYLCSQTSSLFKNVNYVISSSYPLLNPPIDPDLPVPKKVYISGSVQLSQTTTSIYFQIQVASSVSMYPLGSSGVGQTNIMNIYPTFQTYNNGTILSIPPQEFVLPPHFFLNGNLALQIVPSSTIVIQSYQITVYTEPTDSGVQPGL
ncbi:MAG: hypothetical protein QXF82_04340 [Nitrososphaeria archaeon]